MLPAPGDHNIRVVMVGGCGRYLYTALGRTEGWLLAGGKERLLPVPLVEESWGMFKCGMGSSKGSVETGETNDSVLRFLSSTKGICFLLNE